MPDPTTTVTSKAVPENSANTRRGSEFGTMTVRAGFTER
jgi:hypothetical protein